MSLELGGNVGSYRIEARIGAGGMGEVYRAFDTTLQRPVAIKVLSEADEQARTKLLAEARAASALDHPNICTVHEVGEADGQPYIVMALVKGKPLIELIPSDGLPPETVIRYGLQIADALAHAHENGVIHRDLKSQNVVITPEGRAKVLDFGLAVHLDRQDAEAVTVSMDTQVAPTSLAGTLAYLAPEVLRGEEATPRSDIWALGVLLYEMASGRLPFGGATRADVVSAIIKEPIGLLAPTVQRGLRSIIQRCLAKEVGQRYPGATALQSALEAVQPDVLPEVPRGESASARVRFWAVAGLLALALAAAVVLGRWLPSSGPPEETAILQLRTPRQITQAIGVEDYVTWSPDAQRLAYQSEQSGSWDIWVAQVGGQPPVNRTADVGGASQRPSWSPDGTQIAFVAVRDEPGYYTMSALGGAPLRVIDIDTSNLNRVHRPQWSPDGSELAGVVIDDAGTAAIEIVSLQSRESRRLALPSIDVGFDLSWSPRGRFFTFVEAISYDAEATRLWNLRIADGELIPLSDGRTAVWSPTWAPDERTLYFVTSLGASRDLWQQPIAEDGTPSEPAQAVTTGIGIRQAAMAPDGSKLAYSQGRRVGNIWRVLIPRSGEMSWDDTEELTVDQAFIEFVDVSTDGQWLLVSSDRAGNQDLWVLPTGGGEMRQLTTDPADDWSPRLSPDGQTIAFYSSRSGNRDLWTMPAAGGPARQLTTHPAIDMVPSWSPDGERLAFVSVRSGSWDLWTMPTEGGEAQQLTADGGLDYLPLWSPDGQWIGFISDRSGILDIWRVPAEGGSVELIAERVIDFLSWSSDGQAVYVARDDGFWEVPIDGRSERRFMDLSGKRGTLVTSGSAASDGQFLYFSWREELGDIWVMDVVQ